MSGQTESGTDDPDSNPDTRAIPENAVPEDRKKSPGKIGARRALGDSAIKLRTIVVTLVVVVVIAVIGVMGWQLDSKSNQVDRMNRGAADKAHAEQVALDYAVAAANMDFHDLSAWRGRLTKGTSPELSTKLTQAASSMEQIIVPLQWVSTSAPITSKVRSVDNGVYSVDCFVSVLTKNSQAPDGIQSTATYRLAIDSAHDWAITDVGGIGAAVTPK
ncbi:hypothetical protein FHY52_01840 [Nocardia nova]|uniref:hypothetical protein n=1 Tax=Nocardia nova TaxID=37330 RepID=UPI0025B0E6CB|nr:hypothetical protein [Nocardia nova]MDN2495458.1 hypothetical protein [Nocardia nova]